MEAVLTGSLRIRPLTGDGAPVDLVVGAEDVARSDSAPVTLRQEGKFALSVTLAAGAFVSSVVGRTTLLRLSIEDTVLMQQTVYPTASEQNVQIGPVFLPEDSMADYLGVVCLQVTLTNEFGVAVSGLTAPVFLQPADSQDNRRLLEMLKVVQDNAYLLATPSEKPGPRGKGAAGYLELLERVVQAYAGHHHYFEKSARFRLQQTERLTSVALWNR